MAEDNLPTPTEGNNDSAPTICDCDYCTQYGGSSIIHRPNCTHTFIHDIADLSLPRCSCPEDNAYGEDMSIPYEAHLLQTDYSGLFCATCAYNINHNPHQTCKRVSV